MEVIFDRTSPYRGADLTRARRLTSILLALGALVVVVGVVPFYPPTATIGSTGWPVVGGIVVVSVVNVLIVSRPDTGFRGLLVVAYISLAQITALQYLAGPESPYQIIDLLLVCSMALTHPYQVALPYAATMVASRFGLAAVSSDTGPGALVGQMLESVVWTMLAVLLCGVMRQVREQRLALHDERSRDSLTGLLNRRSYDERLEAEVAAHRESDRPLSLLLGDLNGFKELNDRLGHLEGDRQLTLVAAALDSATRPSDVCFRWGGDEFAVLLPGTDERAAGAIAAHVRSAVAEACPLTIGLGHATLLDGDDANAVTARADLMLMDGKRARGPASVPHVGPVAQLVRAADS